MNDLTAFIPLIAAHLGVTSSTVVFLIFCLNQVAKVAGRLIPNDATGALATLRNLCAIIGADPSSRITAGVSVQDVAAQALTTQSVTVTNPASDPVPVATKE